MFVPDVFYYLAMEYEFVAWTINTVAFATGLRVLLSLGYQIKRKYTESDELVGLGES